MLSTLTLVALLAAAPSTIPEPSAETRISLDVKETSIADIVRVLAEVGGFQVVMEPGLDCKLTLKLNEVPWPRVLDVALKTCRLGYDEEHGILRIAPVAKLAEEHAAERRFKEEQRLNRPLRTVRHRLSYAKAEQLAPVIKKFLSPRGEVVVDARTNTLIITDIE